MNQDYQEVLIELKLSIHRALWREVIPSLREVILKWEPGDEQAIIRFYHSGEITDEIESHYSCIHTEVDADFIDDPKTDFEIIRCDYPNALPKQQHVIYSRKEPFADPTEEQNEVMKEKQRTQKEDEFINSVENSIHRALLGGVVPSMRGVILKWKPGDEKAMIHFYHTGEITNVIKVHYSSIMLEIDPVYWGESATCGYEIIRCDPPDYVPTHEDFVVYLRKEPFKDPTDDSNL